MALDGHLYLTFHTNKEISLEYSLQSISHCILIRIDLKGTVKPVGGCDFAYGVRFDTYALGQIQQLQPNRHINDDQQFTVTENYLPTEPELIFEEAAEAMLSNETDKVSQSVTTWLKKLEFFSLKISLR